MTGEQLFDALRFLPPSLIEEGMTPPPKKQHRVIEGAAVALSVLVIFASALILPKRGAPGSDPIMEPALRAFCNFLDQEGFIAGMTEETLSGTVAARYSLDGKPLHTALVEAREEKAGGGSLYTASAGSVTLSYEVWSVTGTGYRYAEARLPADLAGLRLPLGLSEGMPLTDALGCLGVSLDAFENYIPDYEDCMTVKQENGCRLLLEEAEEDSGRCIGFLQERLNGTKKVRRAVVLRFSAGAGETLSEVILGVLEEKTPPVPEESGETGDKTILAAFDTFLTDLGFDSASESSLSALFAELTRDEDVSKIAVGEYDSKNGWGMIVEDEEKRYSFEHSFREFEGGSYTQNRFTTHIDLGGLTLPCGICFGDTAKEVLHKLGSDGTFKADKGKVTVMTLARADNRTIAVCDFFEDPIVDYAFRYLITYTRKWRDGNTEYTQTAELRFDGENETLSTVELICREEKN